MILRGHKARRIMTHGSLIFTKVLRIYNGLYLLPLRHFISLCLVWKGRVPLNSQLVAMSEKQAWEFFALQELNFQFLELNFQFLEGNFKMSEPCVMRLKKFCFKPFFI